MDPVDHLAHLRVSMTFLAALRRLAEYRSALAGAARPGPKRRLTITAGAVHLEIHYPDVEHGLNRWLPLVKWLLAIPHYVVLVVVWLLAIAEVVVAWFAILFTGRDPRPLFDYVVGVARWSLRVGAYAFLLVTDRSPPFSLR